MTEYVGTRRNGHRSIGELRDELGIDRPAYVGTHRKPEFIPVTSDTMHEAPHHDWSGRHQRIASCPAGN